MKLLRGLAGIGVLCLGVWLMENSAWIPGVLAFAAGVGIANGSRHDSWFSYDFSGAGDDANGGDGAAGD
jgi:hypothetical protein